jgi:hypothetical protein
MPKILPDTTTELSLVGLYNLGASTNTQDKEPSNWMVNCLLPSSSWPHYLEAWFHNPPTLRTPPVIVTDEQLHISVLKSADFEDKTVFLYIYSDARH